MKTFQKQISYFNHYDFLNRSTIKLIAYSKENTTGKRTPIKRLVCYCTLKVRCGKCLNVSSYLQISIHGSSVKKPDTIQTNQIKSFFSNPSVCNSLWINLAIFSTVSIFKAKNHQKSTQKKQLKLNVDST